MWYNSVIREENMSELIIILTFVFVIGLCIGSFLNVVILRALSEESIVFPASKCPKCQHPLKWWHNIPVFSYIFLRGKCAFCKEPISIQYPIIELLTAVIYVLVFLRYQFSSMTLFLFIVVSLLIVIAGTDIKEKVVFDCHTYSLIGVGLLYSLITTCITWYHIHHTLTAVSGMPVMTFWSSPIFGSIVGSLFGAIIMEILARAGYLFVGTRAFGEGDTFIAAGLGTIFGWQNLLIVLLFSVIIQVLIFLPMFIAGLIKNKDWKTLISFVSFVIYALGFYLLQVNNIISNGYIYLAGVLILAVLGVISCIFIFAGLKENPEQRTYLPFGPAMAVAGLLAIIF